jgi:hypothetical protein
MVGWSLLTDFCSIKRAEVPISRSLKPQFLLTQQALTLRFMIDINAQSGASWIIPMREASQHILSNESNLA